MSNVTSIKSPEREEPKARDVCETVIRAKQILRAVRVASEHDDASEYEYALEQAEDMLEEAQSALSVLADVQDRKARS